jgi:hypothetical protein
MVVMALFTQGDESGWKRGFCSPIPSRRSFNQQMVYSGLFRRLI